MENRVKMFNKFDLTEEEKKYIGIIDNLGDPTGPTIQVNSLFVSYYLAKQIEYASETIVKSNEKLAKATNCQSIIMIALTVAIAVMTLIMVL